MTKITKRLVDGLQPDLAGKDLFVWDDALKGFGIRMKPSGAAAFLIQYRNAHGQTRRMVVGKLGTLTPDEARDLAREKLATVPKGADPSAERHAAREAMTVDDLCDLYLEETAAHVKASTHEADKGRMERHIKPLIGRRTVVSLTLTDIERLQADIAAGKSARTKAKPGRGADIRGGRAAAARTVGMFRTVLEFAKRRRIIPENPANGFQKFADEKCRRFLSLDEIKRLGLAMRDAESEGENKTGLAAIRALLLTGCRRNEILSLPRAWLDPKARCIRFEDTKSGAQLRPIGAEAARHLADRPERDKCPWLFPADRGDGHFVGLPRVLDRLCVRASTRKKDENEDPPKMEGVTLHVLRHTFAAVAAELGFSELTIAGLLGHTVPGVTARYAHVPDSALVAAADRVSARIAAALDGKDETGQVVELRRA